MGLYYYDISIMVRQFILISYPHNYTRTYIDPKEAYNTRYEDSDGKYLDTPNGRSARLKYIRDDEENKLHANVVSWGSEFEEANAMYIKIANDCGYESSDGFRLFPVNYLKGLPLISLATAGDEEIKKHKEGIEKGITNDQIFMAYRYYIEENYTKAFPLLKTLADTGNVNAMLYLSQCFYNGYGTKQNKTEGGKWYSKWKNAEKEPEEEQLQVLENESFEEVGKGENSGREK